MEDHRGPEHTVQGQLDPAGRTGDPQVPGFVDPQVWRAQSIGPGAQVEFRFVLPVFTDAYHYYR